MRSFISATLGLVLIGCSQVSTSQQPQSSVEPVVSVSATPEPETHQQFVTKYLEAMLTGETGGEFWCPEREPSTLFAVRGYKILKESSSELIGTGGMWEVAQIESSTQTGSPVIKNWNIGVKPVGSSYCITDLIDSDKYK